jgi:hypothetical protein
MPDLDGMAARISAELAPVLKRMETDMLARIAAATVRSAMIDRSGALILTFGDGSTKDLGVVVGQDGKDGADGRDGTDGVQGLNGADGADGAVGPAGTDGHDGVDGKDGAPGEAGPAGEKGEAGERGLDGAQGPAGADGTAADLAPVLERLEALEGRSVKNGLIERDGGLVLLLADGSSLPVGKVVGRDGVDGKDGLDGKPGKDGEIGEPGLGFDDLSASLHDDGRTVVLAFMRGTQVKSFELVLPAMLYRGVYEAGRIYTPGDTVTFGGSSWVCNAQTGTKPGEGEKAWTLAVKRGRDGKDFAGPQVKVGS